MQDAIGDRFIRRCSHSSVRHWILFTVGLVFGYFFAVCLHISPQPFICAMGADDGSMAARNPTDKTGRQLLLVAVMTAQKYLDSRVPAIVHTWGRSLQGRLLFFVGENATYADPDLPIIRLAGVDDTYPPQKKSLLMMKYIHENYVSRFHWFLRADDDVYVRTDYLERLLSRLDADRPYILGQAGFGKREEYGRLGLADGQPYCMGGTGVVLSREALMKTAPNVHHCLQDVRSNHEDVELNRCVHRFAGVTCTWSLEAQSLFYNNYTGSMAYTGDLNVAEVHRAIVLHPIKNPATMHSLYRFFQRQRMADLADRMLWLLHQIDWNYSPVSDTLREQQWTLKNSSDWREVTVWQFFQLPFAFCAGASECPRHPMKSHEQYAVKDIARQVVDTMNSMSRQRQRIVDYRSALYGYRRVQPGVGADYILDLLLLYKKLIGRRATVLVRRHAYVRQSFSRLQASDAMDTSHPVDAEALKSTLVHVIVPLHGRLTSFQRFIDHLEKKCLSKGERVFLIVVLFPSDDPNSDGIAVDMIDRLNIVYGTDKIATILVLEKQPFNRAVGLSKGAEICAPEALMFFADVDMLFTPALLYRIRLNTIRRTQVFFPVVFSEYKSTEKFTKYFNRSHLAGHFRYFGYGLVSLYKEDFDAVGRMNTAIRGWGLEDVDLFEKFVTNPNYTIFRGPEPELIHVYHNVTCAPSLPLIQFKMCNGRKADGYLNRHQLADIVTSMFANVPQKQQVVAL